MRIPSRQADQQIRTHPGLILGEDAENSGVANDIADGGHAAVSVVVYTRIDLVASHDVQLVNRRQ